MTEPFIHESAYVDEGAHISEGTKVWHYSHVMPEASIGEGCTLGQNVFVADNVEIGSNVKIQNNVSVYEGVVLEDGVFCGPSMVFTNVSNPRSPFPRDPSEGYEDTLVRQGATLGANCTIVCGVEIGEWAFIGAGAVVTDDVPPYALMLGVPAKRAGWACRCGELLKLDAKEAACTSCNRSYELIAEDELRHVDTEQRKGVQR